MLRSPGWLNIQRDGFPGVLPQDQSVYDPYSNATSPPGIYNDALDHSLGTKSRLRDVISQAKRVHGKTSQFAVTNVAHADAFKLTPQAIHRTVAGLAK